MSFCQITIKIQTLYLETEKKIDNDGKQTAKSNTNGSLSPKKLLSKKNDCRGYSIRLDIASLEILCGLFLYCGGKSARSRKN